MWLTATAALSAIAPRAGAQAIELAVSGVVGDSMPPAPLISLRSTPPRPDLGPFTLTLEMSSEAQFQSPFLRIGTSEASATFHLDSLLTEHGVIFLRSRLIDRLGAVEAEVTQRHIVRGWVGLVAPAPQSLVILPTRKPRFIWTSPPITLPPGLWEYDLTVINTATGLPDFLAPRLSDTSFVFPDSLEANTSYRWEVRARARNSSGSGEVLVASPGTFAITSPDRPTATVFYQNFPNPFGRGERSAQTCFWFDLDRAATVRLTIYDIRLHEVRKLIPGLIGSGSLTAGAYGRANIDAGSGCDPRLAWDGRDDRGRVVPPGVYVAEFHANGKSTTRKILFKGP